MIESIIRWSVHNRFFVLLATLMLVGIGGWSLKNTPVDAIPDLSDVQVIIKTSYPGQAPQVVEDQVTYPLTTAMLSVPGAVTVRGYSFFGDSYVYVIFDEDTPHNLIKSVGPHVLVKGSDYEDQVVVGQDFAEELRLVPLFDGKSTTNTIKKIQQSE